MNSLMSYGSDDNSDDSGDDRFPEMPGRVNLSATKTYRKPPTHEDNYDEVGMDMSEDSNDSSSSKPQEPKQSFSSKSTDRSSNSFYHQRERSSSRRSRSPKKRDDQDSQREGRDEQRSYKDDRNRRKEREDRGSRDDERSGRRDDDRDRRDDDNKRDRYRDDRRDRKDDRYSRDRRDRRRSRSRDRRRSPPRRSSRSPRRGSRSPKRDSKSPRRSRSGSRDKTGRGLPSRREKAGKRMDRLGKLGIEFKPDSYPASAIEEAERNNKNDGNRFFMPGITGRFRDQIEKRKLLWQKGKDQESTTVTTTNQNPAPTSFAMAGGSKSTKVYEATTFADDKTSNKFKRLMGIKETDTSTLPVKSTDVLKKQQEMFSSMEAQYEVARTATHTMRGVGLGFGSFQR